MASSTSLVNDGNAVATTIIESTQLSSPGSNILVDNSGNFALAEYVAGSFTYLFKVIRNAATCILLGASGKVTEVIGGLQVDQGLTVVGTTKLDNNSITTNGAGGITATSLTAPTLSLSSLTVPTLNLSVGNISAIKLFRGLNTGAATYLTVAHGLGKIPQIVIVTPTSLIFATSSNYDITNFTVSSNVTNMTCDALVIA